MADINTITEQTMVEDIFELPGITEYFLHHGVSPFSCAGAFPRTVGELLRIKKVADIPGFIEGLNALRHKP